MAFMDALLKEEYTVEDVRNGRDPMSGQILKQFASGNQTIQVILSDVVKERGYDRAVDAISAAAKEAIGISWKRRQLCQLMMAARPSGFSSTVWYGLKRRYNSKG